ncbi:helix-turn-helix transcriptional regulator [Actinacidiphila alni]|uniref:helix-turn-helix domain-containing protein n=1 Tax=Actinacidiphila alni TaxID=380248 RepID=UPI0033EBEDDA
MTEDSVTDLLAAMGPRLRAARERHGASLTEVCRATGLSPSTLSRVENGRRKPHLELLLHLAAAYGVPLDELTGTAPPAPAPAPTPTPTPTPARTPPAPNTQRRGDDKTVLPLTHYVGGVHAHKHVLPAADERPARPRLSSHEGYEWLCVLSGRLWLALGEHDLVLTAGEVAEFDTRTPHGVANAGPAGPVEYLAVFGPQGERLRSRVRPETRTRPRTETRPQPRTEPRTGEVP